MRYNIEREKMPGLIFAILLWGIFHSLFASTGMKDLFRRTLGNGFMKFYRLFYNVFAVISFLPILYLMVTLPDRTLYQIPAPYHVIMRAGQLLSIIFLYVAMLQTDILSFTGLRQIVEEDKRGRLVTVGLYRYVRHPLYTFSLAILWFSPSVSLNMFVVYLVLTVYVLTGIIFEERKLLREFGREYAEYRAATPMLIPGVHFLWNK